MAVRASCRHAFSEGFQAAHLCFDPAAGVVSVPALPKSPAVVSGGAQCLVSGDCGRAAFSPRPPVLADGDDRGGLPVDDGGVASARVIGAVRLHCADLSAFGDLVVVLAARGCHHHCWG